MSVDEKELLFRLFGGDFNLLGYRLFSAMFSGFRDANKEIKRILNKES